MCIFFGNGCIDGDCVLGIGFSKSHMIACIKPITDPWDWYIYLHEWLIFMVNVAKYSIHGSHVLYIDPYIYPISGDSTLLQDREKNLNPGDIKFSGLMSRCNIPKECLSDGSRHKATHESGKHGELSHERYPVGSIQSVNSSGLWCSERVCLVGLFPASFSGGGMSRVSMFLLKMSGTKKQTYIVVSYNIFFESIILRIFSKLVISQNMLDSYYFGYHFLRWRQKLYIYIYISIYVDHFLGILNMFTILHFFPKMCKPKGIPKKRWNDSHLGSLTCYNIPRDTQGMA